MRAYISVLRQRVRDSRYAVDEAAVADAVLASTRRATARSRQRDTTARIIKFLTGHPQSTTGDLARSLNLDPESVSTSLNQLANAGEIKKHTHGFSPHA